MNSPTIKPEQLSPKLSPVAFSLDDPNNTSSNVNNFQHILASPTKLSLDGNANGNNGGGAGNSLIYRTSLSKLSELSRRGRSRQRSNSDTLRSASPTRLQFFNNGPKMLKPEYVSHQPSGMPLLSALIGNGNAGSQNSRMSIKETLEMFHKSFSNNTNNGSQDQNQRQRQAQQLRSDQNESQTDRQLNETEQDNKNKNKNKNKDKNENNDNNDKLQNRKNQGNIMTTETEMLTTTTTAAAEDADGTLKRKPSSPHGNMGSRMASNSSVASSSMTVNFNDMSREVELDMLPTDKNGFVELIDGKSNRCSFISSSSTDFDPDWYNHQNVHINEETTKLDHRIKQLELEIDELKLQNQKLIRSITTSRTVEDKFMLDALKEIRNSKQRAQRSMERKVRQLERKVENYRKALGSVTNGRNFQSKSHNHYGELGTYLDSPRRQINRRRIARISSVELRKIEENSDSSSQSSSSSPSSDKEEEEEEQEEEEQEEEYEKAEKTFGSLSSMDEAAMIQDGNTSLDNSMRRIGGLQLNIQLEMEKNNNNDN